MRKGKKESQLDFSADFIICPRIAQKVCCFPTARNSALIPTFLLEQLRASVARFPSISAMISSASRQAMRTYRTRTERRQREKSRPSLGV